MNEEHNERMELRIPRSLFEELQYAKKYPDKIDPNEVVEKILKSQMFQMLNDYPIPHEWCLHLRQIVTPQTSKHGTEYNSYQCINCGKYF